MKSIPSKNNSTSDLSRHTAASARAVELRELIHAHDYQYYVLNSPTVGDSQYDNFLEELVIDLGLDWTMISKDLNSKHWKKILNDNVKDMYSGNCWGVPSFKITNEDGTDPFYVWGQDRIWLLKEEIARRLS